jgi:hypothetical protein
VPDDITFRPYHDSPLRLTLYPLVQGNFRASESGDKAQEFTRSMPPSPVQGAYQVARESSVGDCA